MHCRQQATAGNCHRAEQVRACSQGEMHSGKAGAGVSEKRQREKIQRTMLLAARWNARQVEQASCALVIGSVGDHSAHTHTRLSWSHPRYLPPRCLRVTNDTTLCPSFTLLLKLLSALSEQVDMLASPPSPSSQRSHHAFCFEIPAFVLLLHPQTPSLPPSLPYPYLELPGGRPAGCQVSRCILGPVVPTTAEALRR